MPVSKRIQSVHVNEALTKRIKQYDWLVLPTYHLTWSRIEHFMAYARCSCHYHRVEEHKDDTSQRKYYHITGPVFRVTIHLLEHLLLLESV
ncbi:hypothetical protein FGIG_01971 [Fasciola gigantica]|uniref:Uncharacterized protein n=1 Tax=Fasciola gigantica TaxID=46835 RepID=A0A504YFR2_FASGI|nr:hypothetical protein FGIG_01971 [Fasciola gigantica]